MMSYCRDCGAEMAASTRFCASCGALAVDSPAAAQSRFAGTLRLAVVGAVIAAVAGAAWLAFAQWGNPERQQLNTVADFISVSSRRSSGDAAAAREYWAFAPRGMVDKAAVDKDAQLIASGGYGPSRYDTSVVSREWRGDTLVLTIRASKKGEPGFAASSKIELTAISPDGRAMVLAKTEGGDQYYELRRQGLKWAIVDRYLDPTLKTDGLNSPTHMWDAAKNLP